jgi:Family of unknown function (DUF6055)
MHHHSFRKTVAALALVFAVGVGPLAYAQTNTDDTAPANAGRKEILIHTAGSKDILIPASRISNVPDTNDFDNPDAEYSWKHSKSTANFVLFWAKEYGDDPMTNAITNRRFDIDTILKESDRFYDFYVNDMKWVNKDTSYATKYKFLFFVIPSPRTGTGTAFGGSVDNKIGAFWTPATRISRGPYGVVAHELGHSFQALVRADGAASFSGPNFGEMTSQWMLWQVYPEWLTFENYHLVAYLKATHLAFLNPDNQYHTAGVPEYWSEKHGIEIIGKLWREVQRGEDVVTAYKRITGITQAQLNDEMFDADRRFVTWDLPRIEKVAAPYRNMGTTSINKEADGWYQIATNVCPQNYGYNAIQLKVPAADTKISLDFKGIVGAEGFQSVQPEKAGWRYGFLAYKDDNTRVYSETFSAAPGTGEFTVPVGTKFLWLVVTGAPTEHWIRAGGRGGGGRRGRGNTNTNAIAGGMTNATATATATTNLTTLARANPNTYEQWPYAFKLTGTDPEDSIVH